MNRVIAVIVLAAALPLAAQKAKPVETRLTMVQDRRSASFGGLTLTLELPAIPTTEIAAMRVRLTKAVDDAGNDLVDQESEARFEQNVRRTFDRPGSTPSPASISVTLKSPPREASKVKSVQGELDLYMPDKDPNGVASIANFRATPGKPLAHKALKANGVELTVAGAAQLEAAKKKLTEAKRKEFAGYGYEGESLEEAVKNWSDSLFMLGEGDVLVSIKDPQQRIQQITLVNPAGEEKQLMMEDQEGFTKLSTWGDAIQDDWTLRVSMKTAKNMMKYSFALSDVALP
jgi:hypothetical protein